MALETLRDVEEIGGFEVFRGSVCRNDIPAGSYVAIDHEQSSIHFKIQSDPIGEVGVNGCQVDAMIEAAKIILEGLDDKFPSEWNLKAIQSLNNALECLRLRKKDREKRGVEGKNLL